MYKKLHLKTFVNAALYLVVFNIVRLKQSPVMNVIRFGKMFGRSKFCLQISEECQLQTQVMQLSLLSYFIILSSKVLPTLKPTLVPEVKSPFFSRTKVYHKY